MTLTAASRAASISNRQLGLLLSIAELHSVRRASEECSMSQPAVTQALSKLEQVVGAKLIERRSKGSELNPAGEVFTARVRRFFERLRIALVGCGSVLAGAQARLLVTRLSRAQVRGYVGLVENDSIDKAAGALGVSRPSLIRAVRDFEQNVGVVLLHRTAAGAVIAPAGAELGRQFALALREIEWGIEEVDALNGRARQRIVIGAMPFGASLLLASVLDRFLAEHPDADLRIVNDSSPEMKKSLYSGDVDLVIGLISGDLDAGLSGIPLAPTPYMVVARRGHPLAARPSLCVDDLTGYDWITGTRGSNRRACFDALFAGGAAPTTRVATCGLTIVHHLLKTSDRIALMTSYELEHADRALRALPWPPIRPAPSLGFWQRADFIPTPLHLAFLEIVRAHVAAMPPALRSVG